MRDYGIGPDPQGSGSERSPAIDQQPEKDAAFNLRGFDLRVVDQVPIVPINEHNHGIWRQSGKMGDQLPDLQ